MCDAPADFQNATSLRHSAGVPEPHDVHTSMPTAFGSRPSARVSARSFSNTSSAVWSGGIGIRHPAIAPLGDARQRRIVMAAEPHRHAPRRRPRIDPGIVDRVIAPLERDVLLRPQRLHHLDLLLRPPAAVAEILVQAEELHLVPADADTEPEASAAQHVEACRLLRHQHRLPLRQDQHAGGEAKFAGAACEKPEQHERIVEQVLRGVAAQIPVRPRRGIHAEHVIGCLQEVIAHRLDRLCIVAHHGGIATDVAERNERAEFHVFVLCKSVA